MEAAASWESAERAMPLRKVLGLALEATEGTYWIMETKENRSVR